MDTAQALALHDGAALVLALTDEARERFLAEAVTATTRQLAADLRPRLGDALAEASDLVAPADAARDAAQAEYDRLDGLWAALSRELSEPGVERSSTTGLRDKATIRQEQSDTASARERAGAVLAAAEAAASEARATARGIAAKYAAVADLAEPSKKVAP